MFWNVIFQLIQKKKCLGIDLNKSFFLESCLYLSPNNLDVRFSGYGEITFCNFGIVFFQMVFIVLSWFLGDCYQNLDSKVNFDSYCWHPTKNSEKIQKFFSKKDCFWCILYCLFEVALAMRQLNRIHKKFSFF